MYNRENIDPRYLGLHVHLGVLECSKPNSGIRAKACFQLYLMQIAEKCWKNRFSGFLGTRLAESTDELAESMSKIILLVEWVHALEE